MDARPTRRREWQRAHCALGALSFRAHGSHSGSLRIDFCGKRETALFQPGNNPHLGSE
jgi:hypothetical protein